MGDTVDTLGIYEILGKNWITSGACNLFCNNIPGICELIERLIASSNPKTDDLDRFEVMMDHEPNGSSAQSILMYAQGIEEDRFQVWAPDYNKVIHPVRQTDLIPIETIKDVPIAMFVGKDD